MSSSSPGFPARRRYPRAVRPLPRPQPPLHRLQPARPGNVRTMLRTLSRYFARWAGGDDADEVPVVGDRRRALRPRAQALDEAGCLSVSGRRRRVCRHAAGPPRPMTSGGHDRLVRTSACSRSRRRIANSSSAASATSASLSPICWRRR